MARSGHSRSRVWPAPRKRALYTWLRRASITGQISMPVWASCQAMDSRVEQAAQGLSPGQASPLAVEMPMRSPVKEPGPAATAMRSTWDRGTEQVASICSTMGIRVREWVSPLF